jgi:CRISPR/Cas system-associated endonuclease/helicase Cas3
MLTVSSCSTQKTTRVPLQEQINDLEVKTAQEINKHAKILLEEHPELSESSKNKIKSYLDETMKKHQELKDEESRVFQLLLQNSLVHGKGQMGMEDYKKLKSHLLKIYESKSSNIFELIMQINKMAENSEIGDGVKSDVFLFIRDFR